MSIFTSIRNRRHMEIISRADALAKGLTQYFPGKPCKKGHIAPYTLASRTCTACRDAARAANKEAISARRKQIRARPEVKAKEAASKKSYEEKNAEAIAVKRAAHYAANRDRLRATVSQWHKANRGKANAVYARRQARIKQATPLWADMRAIDAIYIEAEKLGAHVDHIIPLQNKMVCGLHVQTNLRPLDPLANMQKKNKFNPADFEFGHHIGESP